MDIGKLTGALQSGLALVKELAPLAALGGPGVAGVASIAATLAEIGENILDKANDGAIVATSDDKARVQALLAQIQAENDALAARVADS